MNGLSFIELPRAGRLARLLGRDSIDAALAELHNTLATVPLNQLEPTSLLARLRAMAVPTEVLQPRLLEIYVQAVTGMIADGRIDELEEHALLQMRQLLGLPDADVEAVHEQLIYSVYGRACEAVVADGRVTDDERAQLDEIARRLRISDEIRRRLYVSSAEQVVQAAVNRAIADGRLSPMEESELERLATELDSSIRHDERNQLSLERLRRNWRISTGEVDPVDIDIFLKRGEFAGAKVDASKCAIMPVIVGSNASGFIHEPQLVVIDVGVLYFTSTRLLFKGARSTDHTNLSLILGAEFFSDGMKVHKEFGGDIWYQFEGDTGFLKAVFDGLMRRSRR